MEMILFMTKMDGTEYSKICSFDWTDQIEVVDQNEFSIITLPVSEISIFDQFPIINGIIYRIYHAISGTKEWATGFLERLKNAERGM